MNATCQYSPMLRILPKVVSSSFMLTKNIVQYCTRVKEVVNAIHGANGELRCTLGKTLTLEGVIGILTLFEMSSFDNYTPSTIESSFRS